MRAAPLAALSLLLALGLAGAPAAQAQLMGPWFTLQGLSPPQAVAPGDEATLVLKVTRSCDNRAQVFDPQTVLVTFKAPEGSDVSGPPDIGFPRQVCAEQPSLEMQAAYRALVPRGAGGNLSYAAHIDPQPMNSLLAPGNEGSFPYTVLVDAPEPANLTAMEPPEQAMPAPGFAFVALGLLAAAAVVARRRP